MNEQQAKVAFFAMYLGQQFKVKNPSDYGFSITDLFTNHASNIHGAVFDDDYEEDFRIDDCCLLLRSIDQLSDEEFANLSIASDLEAEDELYFGEHTNNGKYIISELKRGDAYQLSVYQYLTRIGILLPFTYINEENKVITLQPAEIIAKGWAKIKQD